MSADFFPFLTGNSIYDVIICCHSEVGKQFKPCSQLSKFTEYCFFLDKCGLKTGLSAGCMAVALKGTNKNLWKM